MKKYRLLCLLFAFLCSAASAAAVPPVLVISVDGLHPAYVTEADRYGLKVPALRRLMQQGAHARGVVGVVPTVTYPSHTTLMTGVTPQEHGIISNTPFDPLNVNKEGWYWYAEDIKAKTLWEVAAKAGLRTASVNWPVTVGDRNISFLLPEYWRASTGDDLKLMRQLDRPEDLMEQLEAKLGPFVDGYVGTVESDWIRTRFAIALLRERKPQFMAVHIIALDEIEHARGPFVAPAFEVLEQLDKMIGEMMDAAVAVDPSAVVAVVSDHGFIATHTAVNLRTRFVEAGLIKLKQNPSGATVIDDWQAQLWSGAASAAVVLRDPANKEVKDRVEALLKSLAAESRNGIARVLDKAALQAAGGIPDRGLRDRVRARLLLRQRDPGRDAAARRFEGHAWLSACAAGDARVVLHSRPEHRSRPRPRRHRHAADRADARRHSRRAPAAQDRAGAAAQPASFATSQFNRAMRSLSDFTACMFTR